MLYLKASGPENSWREECLVRIGKGTSEVLKLTIAKRVQYTPNNLLMYI